MENETTVIQVGDLGKNFGRSTVGEDSTNHDQVIESNFVGTIMKEVDNAVTAVENRVHDAILTTMGNVVIPRVKMAVKSIIESSGWVPNSVVQILIRGSSQGTWKKTPLMTASSRVVINIGPDRNEETRNVRNFEDSDIPALRCNCDKQPHAHRSLSMQNGKFPQFMAILRPKLSRNLGLSLAWNFGSIQKQ